MNRVPAPIEEPGELVEFKPEEARRREAQSDAVIEYAKRVKDWPTLDKAIDQKLKDQAKFVEWWEKHVTPNHGAGRGNKKRADRRIFSLETAETQTDITAKNLHDYQEPPNQ